MAKWVVRMLKLFKALKILILLSLAFPKGGFGDEDEFPVWIENYYNCVCHGGDHFPLAACKDRIDTSDYKTVSQLNLDQLTTWITQVRRARDLLDLAASGTSHTEQRSCLQTALSTIRSSLGFMMKEIQVKQPELPILVKALYKTSSYIYQWATKNCLTGQESQPIGIQLPDYHLCRAY